MVLFDEIEKAHPDLFNILLQVFEDGILTAMRVPELYDGGPLRAIHEFLARNEGRYEIDRTFCDYFCRNVTWNVDGYLRRC